jgi:hypothetical protein
MVQKLVKLVLGCVAIFVLSTNLLSAQNASGTLSGTVTDSSGKPAPNVKVTAKNSETGASMEARTDAEGRYSFSNLPRGNYEISLEGATSAAHRVTLSDTPQTLNLALPLSEETLPSAPSPNPSEPSLQDLGFSASEAQADVKRQALLDKRTHMLKIHQRMGLITTVPLIASVVTSLNAGGKSESSATRDLHAALGSLTGGLYGITAYYAIRAPRIPGTKTKGPIKVHKILAWIHGPGMIATPILGAIALQQKNSGEKIHGVASAHGPVAIVTAGAFGAALLVVSVRF